MTDLKNKFAPGTLTSPVNDSVAVLSGDILPEMMG
jgi:hypothetical protein